MYDADLEKWTESEIKSCNMLANRIPKDICPSSFSNMTAKQFSDHIANFRD